MNDLFAPPGNAWQPVSPQLGRMRRLLLVVLVGVLVAVTLVVALVFEPPTWVTVTLLVVPLALLGPGWFLIGRNARSWGYAERDEDLYVTHGAMFKELVAVPYGRMQFVDVTSGPVEQLFGISTVHLHTASPRTSAAIPGLPKDEAARLRDRLTTLGQAQAAGL